MDKKKLFLIIVSCITAIAAATAAAYCIIKRLEKTRRDEEELQHYIDCAIE